MSTAVDLNADLGEGAPFDAELMGVITSCNIACGGHAGDEQSMRIALQQARENNVAAGAHPSFPDRENFGRTKCSLNGSELETALRLQVQTLKRIASEEDVQLTHLKPHGALYNMAAVDENLARSVVSVLIQDLAGAVLFGPPASALQKVAAREGIGFVAEGFADRAYEVDGRLRDRAKPGAMVATPNAQAQQAMSMVKAKKVISYTVEDVPMDVQTICVHGDSEHALDAARAIRTTLEANGIAVCRYR